MMDIDEWKYDVPLIEKYILRANFWRVTLYSFHNLDGQLYRRIVIIADFYEADMGSILPPNDFSAIPFCSHEQGHTRLDRISNTEHDWMNRGSQIDSWSHREQTAFAKNDSQRKDAVDNSCFDLMKYAGTTRLSTCHMGRSLTCAGRTSAFIQFALVGYSLTSNYFCPNKEPQK